MTVYAQSPLAVRHRKRSYPVIGKLYTIWRLYCLLCSVFRALFPRITAIGVIRLLLDRYRCQPPAGVGTRAGTGAVVEFGSTSRGPAGSPARGVNGLGSRGEYGPCSRGEYGPVPGGRVFLKPHTRPDRPILGVGNVDGPARIHADAAHLMELQANKGDILLCLYT